MYAAAHKIFSVGIVSILAFFLRLHIITALLVIFVSPIVGTLPDIDLKLNQKYGLEIKHRGITHHPLIIAVFAILASLCIFFIGGLLEILTGISWATGLYPNVIFGVIPIPNFENFFSSELILILLCMLAAGMSHLILDVPTYMGIDIMGEHYEGSMRSAGIGNLFFIMLGVALTIIGGIGNVAINLLQASISENVVYGVGIGCIILSIAVVVISITIRKRKDIKPLYCGTVDTENGDVGICSPSRCVSIDDHEACFDDDLSF